MVRTVARMGVLDFLNQYANLLLVLVTFAYMLANWRLVRETRRLHEIHTEPAVGVFLSLIEPWQPIFQALIRNFGNGPAKNVRWQITADMADLQQRNAQIAPLLAFPGLPYLAPSQELRFNLGTTFSLLSDSAPKPAKSIHVKIFCESVQGKRLESDSVLDFEPFRDTALGAPPPTERIAKTLEDLARTLRNKPSE